MFEPKHNVRKYSFNVLWNKNIILKIENIMIIFKI
jgi:hypothetical protein